MMQYLLDRLGEPSSYAGAMTIAASGAQVATDSGEPWLGVIAGLCGFMSMLLK